MERMAHRSIKIQHCRIIMRQTNASGSEITGKKNTGLDEHYLPKYNLPLGRRHALLLLESLVAILATFLKGFKTGGLSWKMLGG